MTNAETYEEFDVYLVSETPKAYRFSAGDKYERKPHFWIARSLVRSITKFPALDDGWPMCRISIPSWKAEQLDELL